MYRWGKVALLVLTVFIASTVVNLPAAHAQIITEFPLPEGSAPAGIAVAFGAVWFTENQQTKLGRLDLRTGNTREIDLPAGPPVHAGITTGLGSVWYSREFAGPGQSEGGEIIGRVDPRSEEITEYELNEHSRPSRIATGFGFVWYTDIYRNVIGRLNPNTGGVAEFAIPTGTACCPITDGSIPIGITTGLGGVWFAESWTQKIGRLDPWTGEITEFGPTNGRPFGVATGFGKVWFTTAWDPWSLDPSNYVGMLDPKTGSITEWELPTPDSSPVEIATGKGAVWFTEIAAGKIGRLDPRTLDITEFSVPTSDSGPFGIAAARGAIWFAEVNGDRVGRLGP